MSNEEKVIDLIENLAINMQNGFAKLGMQMEKMQGDIQKLAEGQQNIIEQNEIQHQEILKTMDEKYSIHDAAIKSLSNEVKFIKHKEQTTEEDLFSIKNHLKIIK